MATVRPSSWCPTSVDLPQGAPILGIVHVGISHLVPPAARRYYVRHEYTHGLVGTICLDGFGASQRLNIPSFSMVRNYGTEDTEAELRASLEAVFNLSAGQRARCIDLRCPSRRGGLIRDA